MEDTFPKLLFRNYQQWGDSRVALRKKEYGIWREYTWKDCFEKVKAVFQGLLSLGLETGDKVSILGDNSPEWLWAELAVQAARGTVIGPNPAGSAEETKYVLERSQSRFVLAQDQEQVDKLLEIKDDLPSLQKIIYWNEKGLRHYDDAILISLAELIRLGEEHRNSHPERFEESLALGNGDHIAMIFYTIGNTDSPEEVPATYEFLLSSLEAVLASNPVYDSDEHVSVISPGWFFEQVLGFGASLLTGQKLNFAESVETAPGDSREISPHTLVYPSSAWDQIASAIQANINSGTWLKRTLFNCNLSVGYEVTELSLGGRHANVYKRFRHRIADLITFRPLRDKHGLNRARVAYAAGGTVSPESLRFFHAIGVNLKQLFGSTEGSIVATDPGEKGID